MLGKVHPNNDVKHDRILENRQQVIEWIGTGWNPSMTPRAMVIEDDMTQRLFTAFVVKQLGLETTCVSSASEVALTLVAYWLVAYITRSP